LRWSLRTKYKLKKLKVGHAGTLDPLATGLLLICTGKMTKKISEIQALEKAYTGIITLGATTPSYDLETAIDQNFFIKHITKQQLDSVRKKFVGEIDQYPPIYSAIKKEGKRLYEYARKGEEIKIESRKVTLYAFDFTKIDIPKVHFHVRCSKGTYIRSLAHDFGKELESGAHLSQLRRTAIGAYTVEDSLTPDQISEKLDGI
jgi:tRNA pseudouridine55 synthase